MTLFTNHRFYFGIKQILHQDESLQLERPFAARKVVGKALEGVNSAEKDLNR